MRTRHVTFAACLGALTVMAGPVELGAAPATTRKSLAWQENLGVTWQTPWAAVNVDRDRKQRGPVLRFLKEEREVPL